MTAYQTHKTTREGKAQTIARRAQRIAHYGKDPRK